MISIVLVCNVLSHIRTTSMQLQGLSAVCWGPTLLRALAVTKVQYYYYRSIINIDGSRLEISQLQ